VFLSGEVERSTPNLLQKGRPFIMRGKVSRVHHMVPGGSPESLPKRKVRFVDNSGVDAW
jgi:hypothetical protein